MTERAVKNLEGLNLENTKITDAGLKELKELKNLQWLGIRGAHVTFRALRQLQSALPKLKTEYD